MDELRKKLSVIPNNSQIFAFPNRELPLHAMLSNAGHGKECSHSYLWDGLKRGNKQLVVWQYTIAGRGRLRYGDVEHDITPGHAMLVRIPENSCYYLPDDSDYWEHIYVSLYGSEVLRIWDQVISEKGPVIKLAPDAKSVLAAVMIYEKMQKNQIDNPFTASALAYEMTMAIAHDMGMSEDSGDYTSKKMRRAAEYVLLHLADNLDVDILANMANMSRYHFSRVFKRHYAHSPGEFIRNARMKRAIVLLQSSKFNIKEIAGRCGFSDFSYFCRAFKRKYQISPGAFRNSGGSGK